MTPASRLLAVSALGLGAAAVWWRRHPSACPYGQRFWVELPHPFITRARLRDALAPEPGERMLEVGPGTGFYTVPVAEWLGPQGQLDIVDVQQAMLDHTLRAASQRGFENLVTARADARALPFADATFDGAFLVTVLGEVPDQDAALRELHRVLRPGGRLVVGELLGDPHWVRPRVLERRAAAVGLGHERSVGNRIGAFHRFARAGGAVTTPTSPAGRRA
jgi:SAM-dependent methyltransferase